ncbi:MAG: DegQ family serine endoprotease [Alphaproteobacteria bacterium]|nr:DegQ family serine endoprotease [Alphaproteobacteria bacterium]MBV9967757.1 DegQ family serine endoprotease [Alphaproteobacteria bacterium]
MRRYARRRLDPGELIEVCLFSLSVRRSAVGAVLALLLLVPAVPMPAAARPGPDGFADLADKLLPSVVNISTTQTLKPEKQKEQATPGRPQFPPGSPFEEFFKDFFNHEGPQSGRPEAKPRKATSLGSGFIIDAGGYIVTNNHVIADADEITVKLHDETELKAELVGKDTKTDVAILKVKSTKQLPAAHWGDSDKARVGDWVLAIGNPFGLGGSVTAGILSARQRDIQSGPYDDFLQTDASINRGNSGGPMFNMDGEVIGINTAIYSPSGGSIGIGFAIPSNLAKQVAAELIREPDHTVHRGWLGVRIQAVTDEIAESLGLDKARGALVASVNDNGPAQNGGIQPGDVILSFDGKAVTDMRHLPRLVAETPVDKAVPVTVWRKRKEMPLQVKVGRLDETEQVAAKDTPKKAPAKDDAGTVTTLGLTLANITPELKEKFSLADDSKGVIVTDVAKDSPAAEKGLKPGDLIVEAAQEEIKNAGQVAGRIDDAKKAGRKSILLLVERQGDLRFVAVRLDQS